MSEGNPFKTEAPRPPQFEKKENESLFRGALVVGTDVMEDQGLQYGDCILSINKRPTANAADAIYAMMGPSREKKPVTLKMIRGGEIIEISARALYSPLVFENATYVLRKVPGKVPEHLLRQQGEYRDHEGKPILRWKTEFQTHLETYGKSDPPRKGFRMLRYELQSPDEPEKRIDLLKGYPSKSGRAFISKNLIATEGVSVPETGEVGLSAVNNTKSIQTYLHEVSHTYQNLEDEQVRILYQISKSFEEMVEWTKLEPYTLARKAILETRRRFPDSMSAVTSDRLLEFEKRLQDFAAENPMTPENQAGVIAKMKALEVIPGVTLQDVFNIPYLAIEREADAEAIQKVKDVERQLGIKRLLHFKGTLTHQAIEDVYTGLLADPLSTDKTRKIASEMLEDTKKTASTGIGAIKSSINFRNSNRGGVSWSPSVQRALRKKPPQE